MFTKIIATGAYVPERTVTNDDLAAIMETSDEWIKTRTGIRERHLFEENENEKALRAAAQASEQAIKMAEEKGFSREEIDLIIVATSTPDFTFPAEACLLSDRLGLPGRAAFDISLACTGFLAAFSTASAYLTSGMYKNALVVGVDVMSRLLDFSDRSTAILFGDGAGAVILSSDERFREGAESGVQGSILRSDGSRGSVLSYDPIYKNGEGKGSFFMEGRAVFEFAVREVPKLIKDLLSGSGAKDQAETGSTAEAESKAGDEASELKPDDRGACKEAIKPELYVLHQANYRIIEAVAKRLKEPMDKFPYNIDRYANTTAATIPMLLDELLRGGRLRDGEEVVMAGFGAGLSLGAILFRW